MRGRRRRMAENMEGQRPTRADRSNRIQGHPNNGSAVGRLAVKLTGVELASESSKDEYKETNMEDSNMGLTATESAQQKDWVYQLNKIVAGKKWAHWSMYAGAKEGGVTIFSCHIKSAGKDDVSATGLLSFELAAEAAVKAWNAAEGDYEWKRIYSRTGSTER